MNQPPVPPPSWRPDSRPHPFEVPSPPPKMTRTGKVLLGALLGVFALCGLGAVVSLFAPKPASEVVTTTSSERFLAPETTVAPTTTAEAPPETFSDPTPPPTTAPAPTTTMNPDLMAAAAWFAWMGEYSDLTGQMAEDGKNGQIVGLLVGCNRGVALIDRTPANFADPELAGLVWDFLDVQRRSFQACTELRTDDFQVLQPQAIALLDEIARRVKELTP